MQSEQISKFLLRLLTFEIRAKKGGNSGSADSVMGREFYDLSHENPFLSIAFSNEIKQLEQEALTEICMFTIPQINIQLARLALLTEDFNNFWKKYYAQQLTRNATLAEEWGSLDLPGAFIVTGIDTVSSPEIRQHFIDDLADSIQSRQQALEKFIQRLQDIIALLDREGVQKDMPSDQKLSNPDNSNRTQSSPGIGSVDSRRPFNFSSEDMMTSFYNILQSRFSDQDRQNLWRLLGGNVPEEENEMLLIFNGNGNQLADAFKQLFEGNLLVGCTKQSLQSWIARHFLYRDGKRPKPYNEKYLSDIISSTTRECQSPILEVKKDVSGNYQVLPTYRTMKNYKKQ